MSNKSETWKFFDKVGRSIAKRKLCSKEINSSHGTSSLIKHLERVHDQRICRSNAIDGNCRGDGSKKSIGELLSKCAVQDGLNFKRIAESEAVKLPRE